MHLVDADEALHENIPAPLSSDVYIYASVPSSIFSRKVIVKTYVGSEIH